MELKSSTTKAPANFMRPSCGVSYQLHEAANFTAAYTTFQRVQTATSIRLYNGSVAAYTSRFYESYKHPAKCGEGGNVAGLEACTGARKHI